MLKLFTRGRNAVRSVGISLVFVVALAMVIAAARAFGAPAAPPEPQAAEGKSAMVVSESADGTRAGVEILKQGGNAVDAAVATALAVGITNASSCGVGGGGFMLIYMAKRHHMYALDYRETAPLKATPTMYIKSGKPDEKLAQDGGLAVAVPGEIAGDFAALKRFGTMSFQAVATPAEKLADAGFVVSPHLAHEIAQEADMMKSDPGMAAVFLNADGSPHKAGDTIYEKDLASTMKNLGDDPAPKFYRGEIPSAVASFVSSHGGILSAQDFVNFRPRWRDPLHREYQGYDVFAMPPPSSGGVLLEMLGALENGHLGGLGADSPPYLARLIEVMRQGFIDRQSFADPDFVQVPAVEFLTPEHIEELRDRALHPKHPENPPPGAAHDHGTSNMLVVDKDGNVVALTTTINTPFGAKIMVPKLGIILNDEMDDFSVAPGVPNAYHLVGAVANDIRPGKQPLSSMTPIIVLKGGLPYLTSGGSGGPTILSGVLQVALNVLESHMGAEAAVLGPRIHEQAAPDIVFVEKAMPETTRDALTRMGYKLKVVPALGAVGAITIEDGKVSGAFDPRKGGGAEGY
jgi:gamma-glutamyltranspeptidase / glutathione hydrolase